VTGQLWQYPNAGGGSLGSRSLVGAGLTKTDRPLTVSTGDANGDGLPDLWATAVADTQQNLVFYPGVSPGGIGAPATIGVGGWQWILRLG
jgi:hypothetical protein